MMKRKLLAGLLGMLLALPAAAVDLGKLFGDGSNGTIDIGKVTKALSSAGEAIEGLHAGAGGSDRPPRDGRPAPSAPRRWSTITAMRRYVNQVGRWVALQSDRPQLNWRFGVTQDANVNSFAAPAGYILITKGLYDRLNTEAELASVLAQKSSHVVKGHHIRAMKSSARGDFLSSVAQIAAEKKGREDVKYAANAFSGGTEIFVRGFDKNDEFESDLYGMVLTARAGYNPFALPGVLTTLGNINPKDGAVSLLFSTHPSPREPRPDRSLGRRQARPLRGRYRQHGDFRTPAQVIVMPARESGWQNRLSTHPCRSAPCARSCTGSRCRTTGFQFFTYHASSATRSA